MREHPLLADSRPSPLRVPPGVLQRRCACGNHKLGAHECEECGRSGPGLLARRGAGPAVGHAPPSVQDVLRSPGEPLDRSTRALMEPRLGQDFSRVRVHTDTAAARSARSVNALAYTVGDHMVFAGGQYAPGTASGKHLLAHELAHVVQQSSTVQPHGPLTIEPEGSRSEREAEAVAAGAGKPEMAESPRSGPLDASSRPAGLRLQRTPADPEPASSPTAGSPDFTQDTVLETFDVDAVKDRKPWNLDRLMRTIHQGFQHSPDASIGVFAFYRPDGSPDELDRAIHRGDVVTRALIQMGVPKHRIRTRVERAGFESLIPAVTTAAASGRQAAVVSIPAQAPGGATPAPAGVSGAGPVLEPAATGPSAAPAPALQQVPQAQAVQQVMILTDLITKAGDAATRDPLVKALRGLLASLQPFMPKEEAQKKIDEAVRSLVDEGIKKGVLALLEGVAGKAPTTVPADPSHVGPAVEQKDLKEQILKTPAIPFPKEVPPLAPRLSFDFRNGPRASYVPGAEITFTIVPPENFHSIRGGKRVVIVAAADRDAANPEKFGEVLLETGSPRPVAMRAPTKPGKYVVRVNIGLSFESTSMRVFEVAAK